MLRKTFQAVLALLMIFCLSIPAAAEGKSNLSLSVGATQVKVGDTFTVTLSNNEMNVISFAGGIRFDSELLTCTKIEGRKNGLETANCYLYDGEEWVRALAFSTTEDAAKAGTVGFAFANVEEAHYESNILYIATFRAEKDGVASFTTYETADGTDAFDSDNANTASVTVGSGTLASDTPDESQSSDESQNSDKPQGSDESQSPAESQSAEASQTASSTEEGSKGADSSRLWPVVIPVVLAAISVAVLLLLKKKKTQ